MYTIKDYIEHHIYYVNNIRLNDKYLRLWIFGYALANKLFFIITKL